MFPQDRLVSRTAHIDIPKTRTGPSLISFSCSALSTVHSLSSLRESLVYHQAECGMRKGVDEVAERSMTRDWQVLLSTPLTFVNHVVGAFVLE